MSLYLKPMAFRRISSGNYITLLHPVWHPDRIMAEHDFLYMLNGSWVIAEEDQIFTIGPDDLLILPAGRHHFGQQLSTPGCRHMYIHVSPVPVETAWNLPEKANAMPDTADAICLDSVIHCRNNPDIRAYFEKIIAACWDTSPDKDNQASLLFNLLLYELKQQQTAPALSSASRSITGDVIHLIQTTPHTFFTGQELARRFFISERTLYNYFKKAYGKTFYACQMELKLEMVRHYLLDHPHSKLHETAVNFGFYDEFHLSKAFKKQYGLAPDHYRKKYGGI